MKTYKYRSLSRIAFAVNALYALTCLTILGLCYGILQELRLARAVAAVDEDFEFEDFALLLEEAEELTRTQNQLRVLQLVVGFVAVIVFLRWTYLVGVNAHACTSRRLQHSPGWCVGWYFVPIANLWKPYSALREMWEASDVQRVGGTLVGLWWSLHIVNMIVVRAHSTFAAQVDSDDFDAIVGVDQFALVVNVTGIALYVSCGMVVHQLTRMQQEKYETDGLAGASECAECGESLEKGVTTCPVCGNRQYSPEADAPSFDFLHESEDADQEVDHDWRREFPN